MKKAQLMAEPFTYIIIIILIALIFLFGFKVIGQIQDNKDLTLYATFRAQLTKEVTEISLKNQGSLLKYSEDSSFKRPLAVPQSVEYVCFKEEGYNPNLIPESLDKSYLELGGNVFLLPENSEYPPFDINLNLVKNPLCIQIRNNFLSFTLENKGNGIVEIR